MRYVISGTMLLLCASAFGQYGYGPGSYSIERWDEDYSYLKDPAYRTDFFDSIKYIPISADGDSYLSLGGQARWRMDYFNNTEFGAGTQDENGFQLFRLLAHADAHFGPNFRVFLQLDASLEYDRSGGPRPGDVNDFDVQQAFFDVNFPLQRSDSLLFRVGRQELIYGAQRLVSPNDWGNVRRRFDGVKAALSLPNDTAEIFLVRPVLVEKSHLDSVDDHTAFAGIYNVTAFPDVWRDAHAKLDTYLFFLDQTPSQTTGVTYSADTFTLGVRPHATPGPWDLDLEADWQFGRYEDSAICAYSIAADAGYTFATLAFMPRLALGLDIASGSPNAAHRFNQLFPPQYLFLGHMYLFGRENIIDLHPELTFNLPHDLTLDIAQHFFWRQNTHDAVYNLNGGVVRASDGSDARTIGSEFDISLYWQIQRHVSAYIGYAHFFTGSFIQQTGPHSDEDFAYVSFTFTF
ncbi:MAG TPA: alginate export family protein [Tepidisphaeraceae bacterium]|nr:alginate export family protein [Tepidisphaeraceae bacterium]